MVDLFAGMGGFRVALSSLGAGCVWSSEWDADAAETYRLNFGETPAGDITAVDAGDVPDHDVLCAGFPCFPAGSPVLTARGAAPIEGVETGDLVLTHAGAMRRVLRTGSRPSADTVVVRFPHAAVECTPNHPFLTRSGWAPASDLDGAECYMPASGGWAPVSSVAGGRRGVVVYNMEVDVDNSYTVHGVAVHNCQAFSISGRRLGFDDARGTLFFDVARIAAAKRPSCVFMENVRNFAAHDSGRTLSVVAAAMRDIGYSFDWRVLRASDYGAPTARERCYMVCFSDPAAAAAFRWPDPRPPARSLRDCLLPDSDPEVERCRVDRADLALLDPSRVRARPGACVRVGSVGLGGQGERVYSLDGAAPTFSAYGGGAFAKTGGFLCDDGRVRRLAPRECLRVMGYPDSYVANPKRSAAYRQIGNSVAVDVLQLIGERVGEALGQVDCR